MSGKRYIPTFKELPDKSPVPPLIKKKQSANGSLTERLLNKERIQTVLHEIEMFKKKPNIPVEDQTTTTLASVRYGPTGPIGPRMYVNAPGQDPDPVLHTNPPSNVPLLAPLGVGLQAEVQTDKDQEDMIQAHPIGMPAMHDETYQNGMGGAAGEMTIRLGFTPSLSQSI